MKEEVLIEIGLSTNEAKIYLALLETGATTASEIAKKSKLHRTNVYDALKKLVDRGLVAYITDADTKKYKAASPDHLFSFLKDKEAKLLSILPELQLAEQLAEEKGKAFVYEGVKAFTSIFDEFLKYNKPILVYGIPAQAPEMMKYFMPGYHKRRIEKKVVMKYIYNHNAQERIKYLNSLGHTEARFLPEQYDSQVSTNICGPEVVLVHWTKNPLVIRIISEEVARSYEQYFNLLWTRAK